MDTGNEYHQNLALKIIACFSDKGKTLPRGKEFQHSLSTLMKKKESSFNQGSHHWWAGCLKGWNLFKPLIQLATPWTSNGWRIKTVLNYRWSQSFLMTAVTTLPSRHKHAEPHTNGTFFQLFLMCLQALLNSTKGSTLPQFLFLMLSNSMRQVKTGRDHEFFTTEFFEAI